MKRGRPEEQICFQAKRPNPEPEELGDCTFYDCLYGPESNVIEESDALIAFKLQEVEREVDKLSDELKQAYFIALQQEIKQQTHYVRSRKFLLMFLRADSFNAKKAAIRMVKFFKYKLELFGAELLPRSIDQDDLNQDDKNLLASGWMQYVGSDVGGRVVMFYQRRCLQDSGYLSEKYFDTMKRVAFYAHMSAFEHNEAYQKKGLVSVRWNLNCNLVLKDEQLIFRSQFVKMGGEALPMRFAAVLICYNNSIADKCVAWSMSVMPKPMGLTALFINGQSPANCFGTLSKYGINVDDLPIAANGAFKQENCMKRLEALQQEELASLLSEMGCSNRISGDEYISSMDVCQQTSDIASFIGEPDPIFDAKDRCILPNSDNQVQSNFASSVEDLSQTFDCNDQIVRPIKKTKTSAVESTVVMPLKYNAFSSKFSSEKAKVDEKFPVKLMEVLQSNINPDAIWWSRGGTAFVIDREKFSRDVLPRKFRGIKFGSFLRQLQRWKFQRVPNKGGGWNCMEYNHVLFQRNSPHLLNDWEINEDSQRRDKLPLRLWKILESNAASDSIWWVCNGKAFAIEMNSFSQNVLKRDFEGLKVSSFLRMLRKWGFKRLPDEEEANGRAFVFQHAMFQQNSPLSQVLREFWAESSGKDAVRGNFPTKLHTIISNNMGNGTVWWLSGGDAFAIMPGEFSRFVLSNFYNGIKFKSFTRNLQRWGFKQLPPDASIPGAVVFQHPSFRKNSPQMLGNWSFKEEKVCSKTALKN